MRYVTLDYINDYLNNDIDVYSTWDAMDDEMKTRYIEFAEKQIENMEYTNIGWVGSRYEENQVCAFPRRMYAAIQTYPGYETVDSSVINRIQKEDGLIPDPIRIAIAETVKYMLNDKFKVMRQMQESNITDFSAGSSAFTFGDEKWKLPIPKSAWYYVSYLTVFYWNNTGSERLVRK